MTTTMEPTATQPARDGYTLAIFAGLSTCGDKLALMALVLWVQESWSPIVLVMIMLADVLPAVFLAPIGGRVLDALQDSRLWSFALAAQAACYAVLAVLPTLPVAVVVTFVSSCISSLCGAAAFVHCQRLVGKADQLKVVRVLEVSVATGGVMGALVGAQLLSHFGFSEAMVVNAATFLVLAIVSSSLLRRQDTVGQQPWRQWWQLAGQQLRRGPGPVFADRKLLLAPSAFGLAGCIAVMAVIFGSSLESVVGVYFAIDRLEITGDFYGACITTWAGAVAVGAACKFGATAQSIRGRWVILGIGALVMGLVIAAVPAFMVSKWQLLALFVVGGLSNGIFNACIATTIAAGVPQEKHGAAWGAFKAVANSCLIAGVAMGMLAGDDTVRWVCLAAGLIPAVAAGLLLLATLVVRRRQPAGGEAA